MEEKKINHGAKVLNLILEKWKKKNKYEYNDIDIFLPRLYQENKKKYLIFPIFNKLDGKIKLLAWDKLNIKTLKLEEDIKTNKIYNIKENEFDLSDSKNQELLLKFAKIYKMLFGVKKNEITNKELLKAIDEYSEDLKSTIGKIPNKMYFEKFEEEDKKNQEITHRKNNEKEIKENKEEKEYSVTTILNMINSIENLENIDYDFEWKIENGLRFVSDEMFDVVCKMLKKGNFSLQYKNEKFIISNNIKYLCDKDKTVEDLSKELDNESLINEKSGTFSFKSPIAYADNICIGCKFEKCPKFYAGYILYLKNKNLLEEKLKDREEFRKNEFKSNYFAFNWEPDIGLEYIPDKIFDFSMELVKLNRIWVETGLENNSIVIAFPDSCTDIALTNGEIAKISQEKKPFEKWRNINRSKDKMVLFCSSYECRLDACPFVIAGYIYYLKMSGQEEKIKIAREYYIEHKDEIDRELEEKKQKKLKELEENKETNVNNLRKFSKKIKNIESLIENITIKKQKNLHITLEGNDKATKDECEKIILELLKSMDKLNDSDENPLLKTSLQRLASSNAYFFSEDKKKADDNGEIYRSSDEMIYTQIKKRKLFIINGISEFVNDFNSYKKTGYSAYIEKREKQFNHIINMLTNLSSEYYIILDATEKEIDQLFDLDIKFKFVFDNNRYKVENMPLDEMYDIYSRSLKPELLEELIKNESEIKKQFIEYVSLNKEFIPLSDVELVNYLASYTNLKTKIVFPPDIYKKEKIDESLKNIIGMEKVKEKVKEFEKYMLYKVKAKTLGLGIQNSNLHMVFTGNPGTGKTSIARIMAKMLYDLGLIKENKIIEVERKDLVAGYIGQTAIKTTEVIEKAIGGVLFIDEAYSLSSKSSADYGSEAIATLIKTMEDKKDEIVVIFAGYRNEMQSFLEINPGISSRIGYTFDFPDYTADELVEIFKKKTFNMGYKVEEKVYEKVKLLCSYFAKRKNFGNGRFIDKLIQETIMKHAISEEEQMEILTEQDIPTIEELNNTNISKSITDNLLNELIGMKELKEKIKDFESYIRFIKEAEKQKLNIPEQNMHMIFTGNPGTGKTTVARIIAEILFNLGIIHENKLIEVERKDLIAGYIGQTAIKTAEVIERAMGGVLFIDEAYSLSVVQSSNDFGGEAIATLIKAMEDHKGEFVVIFAGYKKEMQSFINMNSGIASRIGYTFDFADYTDEEYCEIYYKKLEKIGLTIKEDAKEEVSKIMKYFCNVENIGNGRFVDRVVQETLLKHSKSNLNDGLTIIKKESIPTIQDITRNLFNGNNMIDPNLIDEEAQKRTAIHEIGHATLRYLLFENPGIKKITINAEGAGTLGYVSYKENTNSYTSGKTHLLNKICVSLAGMAAEQLFLGEFENGNTSDLEKATKTARSMIVKYGMSNLGFAQIQNSVSGELEVRVQDEMNKILAECFEKTIKLLEENKPKIEKSIDYIMINKEIDEEQFIKIFESKSKNKQ